MFRTIITIIFLLIVAIQWKALLENSAYCIRDDFCIVSKNSIYNVGVIGYFTGFISGVILFIVLGVDLEERREKQKLKKKKVV